MIDAVDNRYTEIESGQKVAYNISGQIALGEVVRVADSYRYHQRGHTIHVRLLHDAAGKREGHISKLTDPRNLLVLLPGDFPECTAS